MTTLDAVRPPTNDTEARLLDAALTLFAEKGYDAASVREIIETTGVTRPVLYYYCANKEDLFRRLVRWKHDEGYRELGRVVDETPGTVERLRAILRGSFAFCARDPRVPRLMFQTAFGPPIPGVAEFMAEVGRLRFLIVHRVMHEGLRAGELAVGSASGGKTLDLSDAAASLALAFCCLMDQHVNVLARLPDCESRLTPELADALLELFLHGAGSAAGERPRFPPFAAG